MRVILCNCPPNDADALARALVEGGAAACVNVIPGVKSYYQWKGQLVVDGESTLLIKAAEDKLDALRSAIVARHPYEVPEIVVLPVEVEASHRPYVEWVRGSAAEE